AADHAGSVHQPNRSISTVVLPNGVGKAVACAIALSLDGRHEEAPLARWARPADQLHLHRGCQRALLSTCVPAWLISDRRWCPGKRTSFSVREFSGIQRSPGTARYAVFG